MARSKHSHLSFRFSDNKLSIHRRGHLRYVLTVWPRPMAYLYNDSGAKKRIYPEFRVIGYPYRPTTKRKADAQLSLFEMTSDLGMSKQEAYEGLRNSMPFKYSISLAPFKSHQWNLIALLSMNTRFYDLLKSSPVLAYLLANTFEVRKRIFSKELMMTKLAGMPQAELLALLRLPDTKSMAKLLRKIVPTSAYPGMAEHLAYCAAHPELMKPLSHLKKINQGALSLVSDLGPHIHLLEPSLLEDVSQDVRHLHCNYASAAFTTIRHLHWALFPDRPFPRMRSLEEMTVLRDQLVEANARRPYRDKPEIKFEPREPPIPGTSNIEPLITIDDLIEEGRVQNHCMGTVYPELYMTGSYYAYRILAPERATVSIMKYFDGWKLIELYGAHNAEVRPETRQAVNAWLETVQPGI